MAEQEILDTEITAAEPMLADEQALHAEEQGSHNLYRKLLATGAAAAMAVGAYVGLGEKSSAADLTPTQQHELALWKKCHLSVALNPGVPGGTKDHTRGWRLSARAVLSPNGKFDYRWNLHHKAKYCGLIVFHQDGSEHFPRPTSRTKNTGHLLDAATEAGDSLGEVIILANPLPHRR